MLKDHKALSFHKCIDPKANITISARLIDSDPEKIPESSTKVSIVQKRLIPRPDRLRTA